MKDLTPFNTASRKQFYIPKAVNQIRTAANNLRNASLNFSSPERKAGLLLLALNEVLAHGSCRLLLLQDAVHALATSLKD